MIEIGYNHLYQPGFIELAKKLGKVSGLPAKTAYRVGKISQQILKNFTVADTKRLSLIDSHVAKDDKGTWQKDEQGELVFRDKQAVTKAMDELLSTRITIEQPPVSLDSLDVAGLTPAELMLLEPMLETGGA